MEKKLIIVIAVSVLIIAVLGFFAWQKYYQKQPAPSAQPIQTQSLGEQIYEQTGGLQEKIPQTNPFETQTNPFEETKTNPFENVYKNPFGQ